MGRESAYLLLLFTVVSESAHRVDVRCVWYVYVRTKLNDATTYIAVIGIHEILKMHITPPTPP